MAGLCEGGNEPPGSLKANKTGFAIKVKLHQVPFELYHRVNGFESRWIGRGGPIAWQARSPDLTPLDFFLWGCMEVKVYQTEIASREELVAKINTAAMEIYQHGLNHVQRKAGLRKFLKVFRQDL
ncbi:hypothetical protein ANN_03323 [Periplaneta americana]|uniref:Uncharacterized protein n=1 Tax=Periplaneta americana TaxID=6978 RepID=A0ABQ8U426_PERAM|nr:hypothetical protein ANN_03323 [Periplaneta americana]